MFVKTNRKKFIICNVRTFDISFKSLYFKLEDSLVPYFLIVLSLLKKYKIE